MPQHIDAGDVAAESVESGPTLFPLASAVPKQAFALRPVRLLKEDALHYTATTFPDGPYAGVEITIRRLEAFGYLREPHPNLSVDILDAAGDILNEVPISRRGFEYLRRVLRFRREETCSLK